MKDKLWALALSTLAVTIVVFAMTWLTKQLECIDFITK